MAGQGHRRGVLRGTVLALERPERIIGDLSIEPCLIRETFFFTSSPPPILGAFYNNEENILFIVIEQAISQ